MAILREEMAKSAATVWQKVCHMAAVLALMAGKGETGRDLTQSREGRKGAQRRSVDCEGAGRYPMLLTQA
jgi:hypothetical protein